MEMNMTGRWMIGAVAAAITLLVLASTTLAQQSTGSTPEQQAAARESLEKYRDSKAATLRNDFGELGRYREANAKLGPPAGGENRVVFFGDSITDMWPLEVYFPGKPYVNRGIGGQTTPQMLIRFRDDVVNLQPKAVVILAGTNDIAGNTGPMTLEDIEGNYASMAEIARANGIRVIFSSVLPVHNYTPQSQNLFAQRSPAKILTLNRWLTNYCAANHLLYLDYFSALVDDKGMLKAETAEDGLHPNKVGYAVMAALAKTAIEKALAAPASPSTAK
jgi:lysophospholipase L1-like esterase